MLFQDPSDPVPIDFDAEGIRNLLRDLEAPKPWVASFHLHDRGNQLRGKPFGPRLSAALRGMQRGDQNKQCSHRRQADQSVVGRQDCPCESGQLI